MAEDRWQDMIAGERMALDREFSDRVRESELSTQEWNLVMTAVEFELEGEGDSARLVADTSKVEQVAPQFEDLGRGMPGGASSQSGDLLDSLKDALGMGGGVNEAKIETASELAEEYARRLQEKLEEAGRWEDVREAAR